MSNVTITAQAIVVLSGGSDNIRSPLQVPYVDDVNYERCALLCLVLVLSNQIHYRCGTAFAFVVRWSLCPVNVSAWDFLL